MTIKLPSAADERHRDPADRGVAVGGDTFVINLCSSTTPMALAHPDAPELKRFKFFVSRRLEDGRERFRLHMGHFQTLEEAEDWLCVVRDVYPGAWAGELPGKRLRARTVATAQSAVSADSKTTSSEKSVADFALQPSPSALAASSLAAPANLTVPAATLLPQLSSAVPRAAPHVTIAPASGLPKQSLPVPTLARACDPEAAAAPAADRAALLAPLSNVREVLAALDARDPRHLPQTSAVLPAAAAPQAPKGLSDTQVMQILEARGERAAPGERESASSGIPVLRPDDSGTRRALHAAVQENAEVSFAVQLQWSVQPMALDKVPPLAIFSAYTLYTVHGSRAGRAWYGLRLGFFSDAVAAKQVAHYVRSDFASVAVVPVSAQERGRATSTDQKISAAIFAENLPASPLEEITLFEAEGPAAAVMPTAPVGETKSGSSATARAASARSKKLRSKGWPTENNRPNSLEETLEILGAGSLEIDNGRGELFNGSRVRHVHVELRKDSPFQKLITRLTERVRKG